MKVRITGGLLYRIVTLVLHSETGNPQGLSARFTERMNSLKKLVGMMP